MRPHAPAYGHLFDSQCREKYRGLGLHTYINGIRLQRFRQVGWSRGFVAVHTWNFSARWALAQNGFTPAKRVVIAGFDGSLLRIARRPLLLKWEKPSVIGNRILMSMHNTLPWTKAPKILLVGEYAWPMYEKACANALESIGCAVVCFGWFDDFRYWVSAMPEPVYHSKYHRIQYRVQRGPAVWKVSRRLLWIAKQEEPTIVWFYNVKIISPFVVRKLKRLLPKAIFCQYTNDDPFSSKAAPGLWRSYVASIPCFDINFSFRHSNIEEYRRRGAKHVELLRAYYIPEDDFPVPADQIPERFKCDVVFAGHYENDCRVEMLETVCEAGYHLNLFGGGWDKGLRKLRSDSPLREKYPIIPAAGAEYRYAICGAKVALCFLSSLNRDTYTRRCFQIPAMKTAMLSQYTDDLASLFQPDVEAVFFEDKKQLLTKLHQLMAANQLREDIAEAGYEKVYSAGHDVRSRMRSMLHYIYNCLS